MEIHRMHSVGEVNKLLKSPVQIKSITPEDKARMIERRCSMLDAIKKLREAQNGGLK